MVTLGFDKNPRTHMGLDIEEVPRPGVVDTPQTESFIPPGSVSTVATEPVGVPAFVQSNIENPEELGPENPFALTPDSENPFSTGLPEKEDTGFGAISDFFVMLNSGVEKTIGLPFDAAVGLTNMILGTDFDLPTNTVPGPDGPVPRENRQTFMGRIGRTLGETVAMTAFMLPSAVATATRGVQLGTLGQGSLVRRFFERLGNEVIQRPGRFLALEAGAATGAGIGGYTTHQLFPDSLAAEVVGEMLGSMVTLVPLQIRTGLVGGTVNLTKRAVKSTVTPFTKKGGRRLGGRRLKSLAGDPPEVVLPRLNEEDIIPDILSSAQASGQPYWLALERAVFDSSPELERLGARQVQEANNLIREQIIHFTGEAGSASSKDLVSYLSDVRIYLQNLIKMRMAQAAAKADLKIAKAGPKGLTAEGALKLVDDELNIAVRQMRATETSLHMAVPKTEVIEPSLLLAGYDEIVNRTSKSQLEDIPSKAKEMLSRTVNSKTGDLSPPKIGEFTTSLELMGFRQKMLEVAREPRNKNKHIATLARELAGLALDQLNAVKSVNIPFQKAREFSNLLQDQFVKGPVGELLDLDSPGQIEKLFSRGGIRGRETFDAVIEAADVNAPKVKDAIEEYLRNAIIDSEGNVVSKRVQRLLEKQAPLMNRLPHLRNEFRDMVKTVLNAENVTKRGQLLTKKLSDKRLTALSSIIEAEPEKELNAIMKQRDRVKILRDINKRTHGVPNARKGLKLTLVEHFVEDSKSGFVDMLGEKLLDGNALNLAMNKEIRVLREVLTDNEIKRLRKIANTAGRLLKAVDIKNLPKLTEISDDIPSRIVEVFTRYLGAHAGAAVSTGSGASIQTANIGSRTAREFLQKVTKTESQKALIESVFDGELFKALYMEAIDEDSANLAVNIIQRKLSEFFEAPAEQAASFAGKIGAYSAEAIKRTGTRLVPVTAGVPLQTGLRKAIVDEEE